MYAVEIAMRAMAERAGRGSRSLGDRRPAARLRLRAISQRRRIRPTEEHPAEGVRHPGRSAGCPSRCSGPSWATPTTPASPRDTPMARALFAVDELCGFLVACALVRPSRSLPDLEVSSVKKKLKDKAFARGVSREDVTAGAEELGVPLDEHIAFVLQALRPHERMLGLGVALSGPCRERRSESGRERDQPRRGGAVRCRATMSGPADRRPDGLRRDARADRRGHSLDPLRELHHPERHGRAGASPRR